MFPLMAVALAARLLSWVMMAWAELVASPAEAAVLMLSVVAVLVAGMVVWMAMAVAVVVVVAIAVVIAAVIAVVMAVVIAVVPNAGW